MQIMGFSIHLKIFLLWILPLPIKCHSNIFGYCLKDSKNPNIKECVGEQALYFLREVEESENFTLTAGVIIGKTDKPISRTMENLLDHNAMDFRGIFENAGAVFSQRSLQWDLSQVYPGLSLRIGPSADAKSMLEFVMDPSQQIDERNYLGDDPTTARIMTQRLILPFLLGLKFNLITIIPLIFGVIILLCKKAAFLAKFAIFLSGIFGIGGALSLGSLFSGNGNGYEHGTYGHGTYGHIRPPHHLGGFAEPIHHHEPHGYYRVYRKETYNTPEDYVDSTLHSTDKFYNFDKNVLQQNRNIKLHEKDSEHLDTSAASMNGFRRFAWQTI